MKKLIAALALCALALAAAAQQAAPVQTVPASGVYVANAILNLRDAPDAVAGKVIGQVAKGKRVEVVEMTYLLYPVQGMRAAWFRLKEPSGWVYGYFLDSSGETVVATPAPER